MTFAAYMDLDPFLATEPAPLPERPVALFVGVLERYKAVDVLADAWRLVAARAPDAMLHIVGRGALRAVVEQLVAELDPLAWEVLVAETRPRDAVDHDGNPATVHDTVLAARRRP